MQGVLALSTESFSSSADRLPLSPERLYFWCPFGALLVPFWCHVGALFGALLVPFLVAFWSAFLAPFWSAFWSAFWCTVLLERLYFWCPSACTFGGRFGYAMQGQQRLAHVTAPPQAGNGASTVQGSHRFTAEACHHGGCA